MPSSNNEVLEVTPASQWKGTATEGVVVTLPSGNNVRVKRTMELITLLKAGRIPNPLSAVVQRMVDQGPGSEVTAEDMQPEVLIEMMKLVDDTVMKCVLAPKIVMPPGPKDGEEDEEYAARIADWTPGPDEIPLAYLDMDDRMFIFVYAQGFASDLESFRRKQEAGMASLSNVGQVPAKTKRTGGGKR